jgi:hypothetical protein
MRTGSLSGDTADWWHGGRERDGRHRRRCVRGKHAEILPVSFADLPQHANSVRKGIVQRTVGLAPAVGENHRRDRLI